MANKPLNSLKFPGLDDTYIVPQIDDTLAVAGKAADAKATGDKVAELKSAFERIYEYVPLEQGGIAGQNVNLVSLTRIRTKGLLFGKVTLTCNDGIRIKRIVYCNTETGAYVNSVDVDAQTYTLSGQYAARVVFGKVDGNANISISDVKINLIWEELLGKQNELFFATLPLEPGAITTNGVDADNPNRIRTVGYIRGNLEINCPDGIKIYRTFYYNDTTFAFDSYVETNSQYAKLGKSNCVMRIVFSKTDANSAISVSDITRYTKSISQIIIDSKQEIATAQNTADSFFGDTDKLFTIPGQLLKITNGLGGFINANAELIATNYIPVYPGEVITVKGRGTDAATALACYYDSNYMPLLSVGGASMDNVEVALTVPNDAAFVRICKETTKTGKINCLATRRNNTFDFKSVKPELHYHGYQMPSQTALPDELLATSEGFVQADVPAYVYSLYDALVSAYPNYVSKVNCNTETEIGASSEYPLYMYKFIPQTAKSSSTSSATNETLKKIMVVSGAHNELAAVYGLYLMMKYLCEHGNDDALMTMLRYSCEFDIIPVVNPYGLENGVSVDENGVDFERNFKTNDWNVVGTPGTKGYSGTTPLSENNTKIVDKYIAEGNYDLFVDCHNFYESAGRSLCWIVPPLSQVFGDDLYKFGCNHVKSMTGLWKRQFSQTFPNDDYIYGYVTIPKENERGGTDYVGTPARGLSYYGIVAFTVESCETCSYINGEYVPSQFVRGTADVMTRVTENILNAIMTILI